MAAEMDIESRVESVAEWMLGGATFAQIVSKAKSNWKVCKRTAANYVARANTRVREARANRVECMIERVSSQLDEVFNAAFAKGDYSAATGAIREQIKLLGLAEPQRQSIQHTGSDPLMEVFAKIVNAPDRIV